MRYNIKFDFVGHRNKFFAVSLALVVLGLLSFVIFGINYGVDFRAGTNMDIEVGKTLTQEEAREVLESAGYPNLDPRVGGDGGRVTVRFPDPLSQAEAAAVEDAFAAKYGDQVSSEVNTVDPELAREQLRNSIIGVLAASVGIIIYVMIRFEWRFAVASIISMLLDAFVVVAVFSIFRLEVSLAFIAAVLTVVGYSINDTIVIFDRIRENLRFAKLKTAADLQNLVNDSIRQTFTRSVNTGISVLLAAAALWVFGSPSIRLFSFAIIIGTIAGAYSSIGIAAQLWYLFKRGSLGRSK